MKPRAGESSSVIYGINPVLELLRANPESLEVLLVSEGNPTTKPAAEILSLAKDAGVSIQRTAKDRLHAMTQGGVHQGFVARVKEFEYADFEDLIEAAEDADEPALWVVLDGIQDPHNLGAIVRSAHALGAKGVVIAQDRAVQVTGAVVKSSAGATAHIPIARVVNISRALERMKEAGAWTVAADPGGDQLLTQAKLDGPLAVVVGAEGPGIRSGVLKHCDFKVQIPMSGKVASLNASVSAALLLYEIARQRSSSRP